MIKLPAVLSIAPLIFALIFLFSPSAEGSVISKEVYEKVDEINRLADKGKYDKALSVLDSVSERESGRYEKNLLLSMRAHIYSRTGKITESLEIYKTLLDKRGVSPQFRRAVVSAIAGIYFSEEKYTEAIDFIDSNVRSPSLSENALKAFCFYKLGDYPRAAELMEKSVRGSSKPPENWLVVLQSIYRETERPEKRIETARKLARLYPTRRNMLLLSNVYAENGRPEKQMAMLKLVYEARKLKKEKYLMLLSRLMFNRGLFLESAKIAEKGIKDGNIEKTADNFEFVARGYKRSKEREKAVSPLKKAVKLAKDNKPCVELAELYADIERWSDASRTAGKCFDKPDAGENHRLYIVKGRSLFNLGKIRKAREEFSRARDFKQSETLALRWLIYIEAEEKRSKRLSEGGIKRRR